MDEAGKQVFPRTPSPSIKKRLYSTFAAEDDSLATDALVSNCLDNTYPSSKRRRRYSGSLIDEAAGHLVKVNGTADYQDGQTRRGRANSEPAMAMDDEGCFMQSMTPPATGSPLPGTAVSRVRTASQLAASSRTGTDSVNLVEAEHYCRINLDAKNGIRLRPFGSPFPAAIQALVEPLIADHSPLVPTDDDRKRLEAIRFNNDEGSRPMEPVVRAAFEGILFPQPDRKSHLKRTDNLRMKLAAVPCRVTEAQLERVPYLERLAERLRSRITTPVPDLLYGYSFDALSDELKRLGDLVLGNLEVVNAGNLMLPFLLIECKGDGGSMWCCTNQFFGGSASCVNVGERLNAQLRAVRRRDSFNSAIFSIIINGQHADLFVSWKPATAEGEETEDTAATFYMQRIGYYALQDMQHFLKLQRCVRMIIEWGMGKRMKEVEEATRSAGTKKRKEREGGNLGENPGAEGTAAP